jgi:hypothetical protein
MGRNSKFLQALKQVLIYASVEQREKTVQVAGVLGCSRLVDDKNYDIEG